MMRALVLAGSLLALAACGRSQVDTMAASRPASMLGLPPVPQPPGAAASQAAADLGRKLFMDRRLSVNNTLSCAMCHVPEQGFSAIELATPVGIEGRSLRRNAPTLLNVAYAGTLFHDGRAASLEQQAWDPLLNPVEMGNRSVQEVIDRIRGLPDYRGRFEAAFGGARPDARTVGAALASYQRTLIAGGSRFDRWRYGGDRRALTTGEQAGFAVFAGKGRCIACHTVGEKHALFSDARFHNTGLGFARMEGAADASRRYQVQLAPGVYTEIAESALAGVSEPRQDDTGRHEVSKVEADRWAYRTPTLRNVGITAPYMHDGSLATLEDVIEYYQLGGVDNPGKSPLLKPLQLTSEEKRDLAAFLRSLTGDGVGVLAAHARAGRVDLPPP